MDLPLGSMPNMSPQPKKEDSLFAGAKILVVDDQAINIRLLQRKLENVDLVVLSAKNGLECLEMVKKTTPDLILLDIMMPELDGIETCKLLKEDPETSSIPVIFITAMSTKKGKLEGLDAGAIDYITKPIDLDETLARVHTQLRLQQAYRENIELQERLSESRRTAAVGAITQGIAHNLNNLLGVVVGYLDLMKTGLDNTALVKRSVDSMDKSISRVVDIIRQLSSLSNIDKFDQHSVPLLKLIDGAAGRLQETQLQKWESISLDVDSAIPDDLTINTNQELFETIILALFNNAVEAYGDAPDVARKVRIETEIQSDGDKQRILIKIIDYGRGIAKEVEDTLFEPFVSSKSDVGCGMGLTVSRHTARMVGGDITIQANEDVGTCACIQHPIH